MAIFHRLATRWLSRIEEDYSRSQVGSYLAHAAGLCPEEDSVLRSGLRFIMLKGHAAQSRLKSFLMMSNETPEQKAKSEGECFETQTGPESSQGRVKKRDSVQTSTPSTQAPFFPLQLAAWVSVPYGFVLIRVRVRVIHACFISPTGWSLMVHCGTRGVSLLPLAVTRNNKNDLSGGHNIQTQSNPARRTTKGGHAGRCPCCRRGSNANYHQPPYSQGALPPLLLLGG